MEGCISHLKTSLAKAQQHIARPVCDCHTWPTTKELHDYVVAVEEKLNQTQQERDARHKLCATYETAREVNKHVMELERRLASVLEDAAHKEKDAFNLSLRLETVQARLTQCQADRNTLVSQNEDLGVQLVKLKGEWPATDGSPMGILQAKLALARTALEQIAAGAFIVDQRGELVNVAKRALASLAGGTR